jgi:O-antigen ligase
LSIAAVLFLGIVYSLSRMGFIAALCSLFLMALVAVAARVSSKQRFSIWGLLALLTVSSFVFLPPDQLIYRFAALSSTEALTAEGRMDLWRETLYLIADYPLVGSGLGAYESAFQKYKVSGPTLSDPYAHNDYLQALAELGSIGFAIFSAFSGLVLWRTVRVARQLTAPETRLLALACLGSISAILIHSLVDFNLYIPANAIVFSWVLGIAAALPLLAERSIAWTPTANLFQVLEVEAHAVE